jgi:peptidoglycan/xylan/chitin deacetylase (PgdA/CDA1 family)
VIEDANENVAFEKNEVIIIPLKERNKGGLTVDGFQVVPILSYHRFADNCDSPLCLPARVFDQQMKYLKENGYRVIGIGELLEFLNYRNSLPKRSVVISIDDGYRSVYNIAWPILKKYGFRATFFIYTDFVGVSRNAITWDQLREMKKSGFEIGSHTISHCDLTRHNKEEDTQAYMSRIEKELSMSKQIIDKKLKQDTILLAFPYGRYDKRVLEMCKRLGYKIAVSVKRGSKQYQKGKNSFEKTGGNKKVSEVSKGQMTGSKPDCQLIMKIYIDCHILNCTALSVVGVLQQPSPSILVQFNMGQSIEV